MRTDRILDKKSQLYEFFTGDSENKKYIVELVKNRIFCRAKSIALCFRGDYASLYYRANQLLKIHCSRTAVVADFDFRHARFTQNYRVILRKLISLNVDISNFSDLPNQTSRRHVRFELTGKNAVTTYALGEILKIYMDLVDDFVNPDKKEYAFDPKNHHRKSSNREKDRQQELYAGYFFGDLSCDRHLLYYDLEYTEHDAEKSGVHGRFDLLGLERDGDGYTILFAELKSKPGSCTGESGIAAHEKDYIKYLDSNFVENRKREACENVKLLSKIFEQPLPENLTPENIKKAKIKFVFSDDAIGAGRLYRPQDKRIEKVYISKLGPEESY